MQELRIAQLGTFDLDNLGDLLFPLVLNEWLRKLEVQFDISIHCDLFGLRGVSAAVIYPDQAGCYPMTSFSEMDNQARYDLVFIGGGDIIRDDDDMLFKIYVAESPDFSYPRFLSPSDSPERRLVLLGVGAPFPFSQSCQDFLANSFQRLVRASVRDTHTAALIAPLVAGHLEVEIVPDIVNSIAAVFPLAGLGANLKSLLPEAALRDGYVCFQVRQNFLDQYRQIGGYLQRFQRETGLAVVLLEIGRCLGDDEILGGIAAEFDFPYVRNEGGATVSIMDKVAVIAHARAFMGTSLHGNIIASAYNVPHFTFGNSGVKKVDGFFQGLKRGHFFPGLQEMFADIPALHGLIDSEEVLSEDELGVATQRIHQFLATTFATFLADGRTTASSFSKSMDRMFLSLNNERLRQKRIVEHFELQADAKNGRDTLLRKQNNWLLAKIDWLESNLSASRAQVADLQRELTIVQGELAIVQSNLASVQSDLASVQSELASVLATASWRVTKPLRYLRRKIG
jgi:hypothetical protein